MSTYPGENPQPSDSDPVAGGNDDTEPTQPVGYWERRAAEEAEQQSGQQAGQQAADRPDPTTPYPQDPASGAPPVFNPTSAQPPPGPGRTPPPNPYPWTPPDAYPPAHGQGPPQQYGQQYGGQQYGQQYGQPPVPPPGQPAYQPVPGQPPYYGAYSAPAPAHPQSTLAMVLGIIGLAGGFVVCGLPLVVSPFAWAIGHNAVKEIRASQGRLSGEGQARAGMIMGIIGTVLLVLAILAVIAVVALAVASEDTSGGSTV
jgi:hypothetical protein